MLRQLSFLILLLLNHDVLYAQAKPVKKSSPPSKTFFYYNTETGYDTKLTIMTKDLGYMTFEEAKAACAKLGKGWRLPNLNELTVMYKNMRAIQGFKLQWYFYINPPDWTTLPCGMFNFNTGYYANLTTESNFGIAADAYYKTAWVRAVK